LINVADQFLDNEFGHDDVNKFQSLVTGARHVATVDSATHGERRSSARYRDIMAPLGQVMNCALRWLRHPAAGATCACIGRSRRPGLRQPKFD
jgi:hypothetical protein